MSHVRRPSAAELQNLINTEKRPLLLAFSAEWCAPCKVSAPHVEAFATKHPEVVVAKLDVDELQAVAARFLVRSVPTFILLREGAVHGMRTGAVTAATLERLLD